MTRLNLITDVPGIAVGNAAEPGLASGVTAVIFAEQTVAAAHIAGGAPAERDTALLAPEMTVERIDAITLAGGSVYGLDAVSGVQAWLRENGRGVVVGSTRVPIVAGAACFDLLNGGNKEWGGYPPYRELAYAAAGQAGREFGLGTAGGGYGATTVDLKGGLGSASARTTVGATVGAIVVVNAVGSAIVGGGPYFWAGPWEANGEFGGLGPKPTIEPSDLRLAWKGGPGRGTTIALVATDARLTPAEAKRLSIMASAGLARALRVTFAPMDGDIVFAAATGAGPAVDLVGLTEIGAVAADCLARAIARGVFEATAAPPIQLQSWRDLHDAAVA